MAKLEPRLLQVIVQAIFAYHDEDGNVVDVRPREQAVLHYPHETRFKDYLKQMQDEIAAEKE